MGVMDMMEFIERCGYHQKKRSASKENTINNLHIHVPVAVMKRVLRTI
jgi:hypothetical protein